jgi:hypothetical protein
MDLNPPETIKALEQWMKKNCFNFNSYSINGNRIYEGYGIEKQGEQFVWYYTERGQKSYLEYFQTEIEIIQYAFAQIQADKWATAHYVSFTMSEEDVTELCNGLEELQISFLHDEIPYYSHQKPAHRVFVFGCDINKVAHLKAKYYNEKP